MKTRVKCIAMSFAISSITAFANTEEKLQEMLLLQQAQLAEIEKQLQALKAEKQAEKKSTSVLSTSKNWQIKSYGNLLYKSEQVFRNTQDIEPKRRAKTDLERVVLEYVYNFDQHWQVEAEFEYEHGGTGAALEYDGFEEFGEFETEIEAGGEVLVEKLQIKYTHNQDTQIKLGHIYVPVGLGTDFHKPTQYFTTQRYWSEARLIPQVWHETGVNFIHHWKGFKAQALVTTGLNSEYFRTYGWVGSGHQKRFEQVNADDLAFTIRLDYGDFAQGSGLGFSYYTGDTSGNRNNLNNISGDGNLSIFGIHGIWRAENWQIRGQYLYGELDDSQEITLANKTTPGLQPGNFAQLGSEAESGFVEAAYNTQSLFGLPQPLYTFVTYQYANPIKAVEQGLATERFDQQEIAVGLNYLPTNNLVFKAQFAEQMYAQSNLDNTSTFSLSLGYYFSI